MWERLKETRNIHTFFLVPSAWHANTREEKEAQMNRPVNLADAMKNEITQYWARIVS